MRVVYEFVKKYLQLSGITGPEIYLPDRSIPCAWFGLVIALLMVFLKNALMCNEKFWEICLIGKSP